MSLFFQPICPGNICPDRKYSSLNSITGPLYDLSVSIMKKSSRELELRFLEIQSLTNWLLIVH